MHVCILVKEFPPDVIGGTETQTQRMAEELNRRTGCEVTVYTKAYPGSDQNDPEYDIVRVPNLRMNPFISTLTFVCVAFFYLLRDRQQYDLLQCMMIYPNGFVGYLLNRFCGLPYFAWIRGGDYYFMKDVGWKRWMIGRVLDDALVLVQTERIERDVRSEFPDSNLRVLGNGVELPAERAGGDAIVFVGRLMEQKGVDVLMRAVGKLGADGELPQRVLVVGDGPERSRLETLAGDLGVEAEFVGWVAPDDVGTYLAQGKLFVLPSVRGEGLPNALLEAYSYGLPAIVTNTGGVADAVVDGETGYVVEPGEQNQLRDRIATLCQDDAMRQSMGAEARRYVEEEHSWDTIVAELEMIYEDCVAEHP